MELKIVQCYYEPSRGNRCWPVVMDGEEVWELHATTEDMLEWYLIPGADDYRKTPELKSHPVSDYWDMIVDGGGDIVKPGESNIPRMTVNELAGFMADKLWMFSSPLSRMIRNRHTFVRIPRRWKDE